MAAKKAKKVVPLEQYSKAELIALVKKLQKTVATLYSRIEKLEGERSTWQSLPAETQRAFIADVDEGARLALHGDLDTPETVAAELQYFDEHAERFAEAHKPFPWEKK